MISTKDLFYLSIIIIIILIISYKLSNNIPILIGLILCAIIIIPFIYIKYFNNGIDKLDEEKTKYTVNTDLPLPGFSYEEHPNLYNFIISIQDLAIYNYQSFEELLFNLNSIIELDSTLNFKVARDYLDLYELYSSQALENLNSIIYSLPDEHNIINFLYDKSEELQKILDQYKSKIYLADPTLKKLYRKV